MSQVALELKNINTTVNIGTPEEKRILKDLNLTLEKGDFVTLLGTNGAGKSTLLNVINGSLNTTSGQVVLNNHDLTKLSEVKRAKYIAQVFQDPKMGTAPRMTVAENLLLATKRGQKRGLRLRGLKKHLAEFKEETAQLPNGLSDRLNTFAGSLSGGQRQRIILARALLKDAQIYILDESLNEVDIKTERQILKNLLYFYKDKTFIVISHRFHNQDLFQKKYRIDRGVSYEE